MISLCPAWSLSEMPTHQVNLDALINREPFIFEPGDESAVQAPAFKLSELKRGEGFDILFRKPDFQRVTHNWTPHVIAEFVRSFLDGEVIPAIIVWQSKKTNKVYIIDGSHRVSALMAWVNNDYGDGTISEAFFSDILKAQHDMADQTKTLIKEVVGGTYEEFDKYRKGQLQAPNTNVQRRALTITSRPIDIQPVIGDAKAAENSFIRINGNQAAIDHTELNMIKARYKPNAIATRAIVSAGGGYKYWGEFPQGTKDKIEKLAQECYRILFGQVVELNIDSSDVPRGGQPYSQEAFTMVLDLVNMFNEITPAMWQTKGGRARKKASASTQEIPDDRDGIETMRCLESVKTKASLASNRELAKSLALDPAVYCYGNTGSFHTGAFLASRKFVVELYEQNKFKQFTKVRKRFEEFLVNHNSFINQLSHIKGSRTRSVEAISDMFLILLEQLQQRVYRDDLIIEAMRKKKSLSKLVDEPPEFDEPTRKRFSKAVERAKVVQRTLQHRDLCPECKARVAPTLRSKEHIDPQEQGGMGTLANLDFLHPFCNQLRAEKQQKHKKRV
jgi:hypothetical protein